MKADVVNPMKCITGAKLIDGTGRSPVSSSDILVEGNKIRKIGQDIDIPEEAKIIDASKYTVMPGLIDSHVHICLNGEPSVFDILQYSPGMIQLMGAYNALETLRSGYTSIRDMGAPMGFAIALSRAIEKGIANGPRIVAGGKVISQTGGHADFYLPSGISYHAMSNIADGSNELRKAAREELRAGADFLKICSSGGVMSPSDPVDTRQFTVQEIKAVVEEAEAVGRSVASHAHGTTGIRNAVEAGVRSIEHGTIMDEEVSKMMAEKGVFHVPTMVASYNIIEHGREGGIPEYAVKKAEEISHYPAESMMLSHENEVPLAAGTDAGTPFNRHGDNTKELELMIEAGLTEMDAIKTATSTAARCIGLGDSIGKIKEGRKADLILVDGDPLKDITILQKQNQIKLVMKDGIIEVNRGID